MGGSMLAIIRPFVMCLLAAFAPVMTHSMTPSKQIDDHPELKTQKRITGSCNLHGPERSVLQFAWQSHIGKT
jgi:hypothetical protein